LTTPAAGVAMWSKEKPAIEKGYETERSAELWLRNFILRP
jgi:hypothetical protein